MFGLARLAEIRPAAGWAVRICESRDIINMLRSTHQPLLPGLEIPFTPAASPPGASNKNLADAKKLRQFSK